MTKFDFVQGDMFATPADIRVNTVNCVGVMGTGVALAFKTRYPEMFKEYVVACKNGLVQPGKLHIWRPLMGDWVINFPTKRHWRERSRYEDIESGLDALYEYLRPLGSVTVALPALGCGHGGLEWARVSEMIREKLSGLPAEFRVYAPSDSRRAGQIGVASPTIDEQGAYKELGYFPHMLPVEMGGENNTLFTKGKSELLNGRWVALFPSHSPEERELRALDSVATELSIRDDSVVVALVHANRTSEEICKIFANRGINVVMLLPFGVLTRKVFANAPRIEEAGRVTLTSLAVPSAKWSRAQVGEAAKFLQSHASAALISAPDFEAIMKDRWSKPVKAPTFFLRYDVLPDNVRDALEHANVTAIGRRHADRGPNLDPLLAATRHASTSITGVTRTSTSGETPPPQESGSELKKIAQLHVDLQDYPEERFEEIMDVIRQFVPLSVVLSINVGNSTAVAKLEAALQALKKDVK